MKIKSLPPSCRPREKALEKGISTLNETELLAIIIESGIQGESALDIAANLLFSYGDIKSLLSSSIEELSTKKGLSQKKALRLKAVYELSKRINTPKKNKIYHTKEVGMRYSQLLGEKKEEELHLLLLSSSKRILKEMKLADGDASSLPLLTGKAASIALSIKANLLVLIHNHPSGSFLPSKQDVKVTLDYQKALLPLSIKLLDHLIVSENGYFSFNENQIL